MESVTKNRQNRDTISKMVKKFFAPLELKDYKELTEGYFNVAYEVELTNGKKTVLKIAPPKEVRVMTYEQNIMHSEVQAMRIVRENCNVPVAKIYMAMMTVVQFVNPHIFSWKNSVVKV